MVVSEPQEVHECRCCVGCLLAGQQLDSGFHFSVSRVDGAGKEVFLFLSSSRMAFPVPDSHSELCLCKQEKFTGREM